MSNIDDLAERVERLLMRHDELSRTNGLLMQQIATVSQERDSLRSRLNAARGRIEALLLRIPTEQVADTPHVDAVGGPSA